MGSADPLASCRQSVKGRELTGNLLTASAPDQIIFSDGPPDLNQCIAMVAGQPLKSSNQIVSFHGAFAFDGNFRAGLKFKAIG